MFDDLFDDEALAAIDIDALVAQASTTSSSAVPSQWDTLALERLQRHWGFTEFRPGQREAIEAALHGRDSLVVLATGSGKSV